MPEWPPRARGCPLTVGWWGAAQRAVQTPMPATAGISAGASVPREGALGLLGRARRWACSAPRALTLHPASPGLVSLSGPLGLRAAPGVGEGSGHAERLLLETCNNLFTPPSQHLLPACDFGMFWAQIASFVSAYLPADR